MRLLTTLLRLVVLVAGLAAIVFAGWFVFLAYPTSFTELAGVVLVLLLALAGGRVASNVAGTVAPGYNVAEVAVEGEITRDRTGGFQTPMGAAADDIVEQIERADGDRAVDALLVKLNTPGGEIVPSEDIRLAAERFDGPTVAYATDQCASGGYEIASGCDEIWARKGSIVGSIGVIGSRVTAEDLADRLGIEYEQLTAGEYKDAGIPFESLDEDERSYLQSIVDDYYDQFVADVVAGRDIDEATIRETEARIYLGEDALDLGLVDHLGTRTDVEERLEDRLGTDVSVREFTPPRGLTARLGRSSARVAYALGAGLGDTIAGDGQLRFR